MKRIGKKGALVARNQIAWCLAQQGEPAKALELTQSVLSDLESMGPQFTASGHLVSGTSSRIGAAQQQNTFFKSGNRKLAQLPRWPSGNTRGRFRHGCGPPQFHPFSAGPFFVSFSKCFHSVHFQGRWREPEKKRNRLAPPLDVYCLRDHKPCCFIPRLLLGQILLLENSAKRE